jgi:hypothetical protein
MATYRRPTSPARREKMIRPIGIQQVAEGSLDRVIGMAIPLGGKQAIGEFAPYPNVITSIFTFSPSCL